MASVVAVVVVVAVFAPVAVAITVSDISGTVAWVAGRDVMSVVSVVRPDRYPRSLAGQVVVGAVMATMDIMVTVSASVVTVVVVVRVPVVVRLHSANCGVVRDGKTKYCVVQIGFSRQ